MRAIDADELIKFPHSESTGTDDIYLISPLIVEIGLPTAARRRERHE